MAVWAEYLFNAIASLASLAIVGSLLFLIKQVGLLKEQTQAAIDASRAEYNARMREVMLKIDEVFLQKPEVRKYFYEGVPIDKNNPDYAYAETTAELLLDIMEHMFWQADNFPNLYGINKKDFWRVWDAYTIDMFLSSPLLLEYAQKRCTWYTYHIIERMERALNILNHRNSDTN